MEEKNRINIHLVDGGYFGIEADSFTISDSGVLALNKGNAPFFVVGAGTWRYAYPGKKLDVDHIR